MIMKKVRKMTAMLVMMVMMDDGGNVATRVSVMMDLAELLDDHEVSKTGYIQGIYYNRSVARCENYAAVD
jgi:hypothetical protein